MSDLTGRVAALALLGGFAIKPRSLSFVAKRIALSMTDGIELSDEQIYEQLRRAQTDFPTQFGPSPGPASPETASEKLERSNAQAPRQRTSPPVAAELTDQQRARLAKMTPYQRLGYVNELALAELNAQQRPASAGTKVKP